MMFIKLENLWVKIKELPAKIDNWLHDPESSFNKGAEVKPYNELLNPEYPDWFIKGKKYHVAED